MDSNSTETRLNNNLNEMRRNILDAYIEGIIKLHQSASPLVKDRINSELEKVIKRVERDVPSLGECEFNQEDIEYVFSNYDGKKARELREKIGVSGFGLANWSGISYPALRALEAPKMRGDIQANYHRNSKEKYVKWLLSHGYLELIKK